MGIAATPWVCNRNFRLPGTNLSERHPRVFRQLGEYMGRVWVTPGARPSPVEGSAPCQTVPLAPRPPSADREEVPGRGEMAVSLGGCRDLGLFTSARSTTGVAGKVMWFGTTQHRGNETQHGEASTNQDGCVQGIEKGCLQLHELRLG